MVVKQERFAGSYRQPYALVFGAEFCQSLVRKSHSLYQVHRTRIRRQSRFPDPVFVVNDLPDPFKKPWIDAARFVNPRYR